MAQQKTGLISGMVARGKQLLGVIEAADEINEAEFAWGYDGVTVSMLLGTAHAPARSRQTIYETYHQMMGDPIISTALRTHTTQALGGHETSGDTIFIEATPDAKGADAKRVQEIAEALMPMLNRIAHPLCFNAAGFGDGYARMFTQDKVGVTDLFLDDLLLSPLVQPYERAGVTTGFVVTTGEKADERLTVKQLARMKMPRMLYVPQIRAMEKAQRAAMRQDDPEQWPHMPALVGGSFLDAAEEPYNRLRTSLIGLVSNRILGSIDESLMTVNTQGMTLEQRKLFMGSLANMLNGAKQRTANLIKKGQFSTERVMHLMPVSSDKQLTQVSQFQGSAATATISIEDVMLQARLLAGAIGIDLSMLGFADQLSGGLGDGGFFRTSVQAAERSDIIRTALTEFIHHVIEVHCLVRYGTVFEPGKRPYQINFYGATSALERERADSRERGMNATALMMGVFQQMKEQGLPTDMIKQIMVKSMELDEDYAEILATGVEKAEPQPQGGGFGAGFGDDAAAPGQDDNDSPAAPPQPAIAATEEDDQ